MPRHVIYLNGWSIEGLNVHIFHRKCNFLFKYNREASTGMRMRNRGQPRERNSDWAGWERTGTPILYMHAFHRKCDFYSTPIQRYLLVGGWEAENNPKNETEIGLDVKELELQSLNVHVFHRNCNFLINSTTEVSTGRRMRNRGQSRERWWAWAGCERTGTYSLKY